jgi:hypothetical protein
LSAINPTMAVSYGSTIPIFELPCHNLFFLLVLRG